MGLEDFRESKTASRAHEKSIWLLLGTPTDVCDPGGDAIQAIKEVLAGSSIEVTNVDFFALRAEQKIFNELKRRLESDLTYVRVIPVANRKVLHKQIEATARREAPSAH
jgi:hypothetical protein